MAKPEINPTNTVTEVTIAGNSSEPTQTNPAALTVSTTAKLKVAIEALDAERTALVKSTMENLTPGKPFDHAVVRDIHKIETRKNRLIVSRFAALLKKNEPGIQAIVHQIIEI